MVFVAERPRCKQQFRAFAPPKPRQQPVECLPQFRLGAQGLPMLPVPGDERTKTLRCTVRLKPRRGAASAWTHCQPLAAA